MLHNGALNTARLAILCSAASRGMARSKHRLDAVVSTTPSWRGASSRWRPPRTSPIDVSYQTQREEMLGLNSASAHSAQRIK